MAVDEAMLEAAVDRDECHLRFYRWKEATVSLGYFQKENEAKLDPLLAGLPVVKRLSGGGAILHEHEWTYSCSVPASHSLSKQPVALYEIVHQKIIQTLSEIGIVAKMRSQQQTPSAANHDTPQSQHVEPFLCFGRGDPRDILIDGKKVVGSAQRRRRGAILQHGSLLIKKSQYAPQFGGLTDLAKLRQVDDFVINQLVPAISELFEPSTRQDDCEAGIRQSAIELVKDRYSDTDWRAS